MRNIVTNKDYDQRKINLSLKMIENNVNEIEAAAIVDKNLIKPDNYQSKLLKLIPTEVVAVFIFISGLIGNDIYDKKYLILKWAVFGFLFIINPFYLRFVSNVTNLKQLIICTLGFAVWFFSLGNNFMTIGNDPDFSQMLGSVILALYTLIVPIFLQEPSKKS